MVMTREIERESTRDVGRERERERGSCMYVCVCVCMCVGEH